MKRGLIVMALVALSSATVSAQTESHRHIVAVKEKSAFHTPSQADTAGLVQIYTNLGTKTDAYNDKSGWALCGPGGNCGFTQVVGMPFTPKSNATVTQVRVAVQHESGTNRVNLSLYNDEGGVPGTVLAGPVPVPNLPPSGTCCTLAIANFESGVAVTAGVQYWVVADIPGSGAGSDFNGGWDFLYPIASVGVDTGTGWFSLTQNLAGAAGAVFGTIP